LIGWGRRATRNEAGPLPISAERNPNHQTNALRRALVLCRLFIPEAVEGLLQALDETRLLLTPSHVAPLFVPASSFDVGGWYRENRDGKELVKADFGYRFWNVWTVPTRTRLLISPLS
jgi:hypothetical protein